VHWLYYQRFPNKACGDNHGLLVLWEEDGRGAISSCVDLYVFGDKYEIGKLRLDCINKSARLVNDLGPSIGLPAPSSTRNAFEYLPSDSPMCRLIINAHCLYGEPKLYKTFPEFDCVPFLQGKWLRYALIRIDADDGKQPGYIDVCDYHEHADGGAKRPCKRAHKQIKN
jgi:hypothetical protein